MAIRSLPTGDGIPTERFERSEALEGRGQVYFHFEVDEKLIPFAIEVFGEQCWVYGSDIPHGDASTARSMSF